jgi:hypothetical protein
MDDSAEPVKVFVRIRPEFEENLVVPPLNFNLPGAPLSSSSPYTSVRKNSLTSTASSASGGLPSPRQQGQQGQRSVTFLDNQTIRLSAPDGSHGSRRSLSAIDDKVFSFDAVFPEHSTQEEVYTHVSSLVQATIKGYNTTIFAYGCTGSGKSYTMTGNSAAPGIIPRAVSEIFDTIETTADQEHDVYFYVRMSYVELYNNNFRNLLDFHPAGPEFGGSNSARSHLEDSGLTDLSSLSANTEQSRRNNQDKIEVRESASTGVFLAGPNLRIPVTSAQEAFALINKGNKIRATGYTQCNDLSSRYKICYISKCGVLLRF